MINKLLELSRNMKKRFQRLFYLVIHVGIPFLDFCKQYRLIRRHGRFVYQIHSSSLWKSIYEVKSAYTSKNYIFKNCYNRIKFDYWVQNLQDTAVVKSRSRRLSIFSLKLNVGTSIIHRLTVATIVHAESVSIDELKLAFCLCRRTFYGGCEEILRL